jgi:hypothetical protein
MARFKGEGKNGRILARFEGKSSKKCGNLGQSGQFMRIGRLLPCFGAMISGSIRL